jgi:dTDP-4-dehydrorhamnose reductase
MLRLAREGKPIRVVGDQICTPTATAALAAQLALLIETRVWGTYHATSAGACAWSQFAAEIFRLAAARGLIASAPQVTAITSAEFGAPARRPPYSVLENRALADLGLDRMRPWQDALAGYIASF